MTPRQWHAAAPAGPQPPEPAGFRRLAGLRLPVISGRVNAFIYSHNGRVIMTQGIDSELLGTDGPTQAKADQARARPRLRSMLIEESACFRLGSMLIRIRRCAATLQAAAIARGSVCARSAGGRRCALTTVHPMAGRSVCAGKAGSSLFSHGRQKGGRKIQTRGRVSPRA